MSIKIKTTILKPKELSSTPYDSHFWHHLDFVLKDYLKYCLSDYAGLEEVLDWVSKKTQGLYSFGYSGGYRSMRRCGHEDAQDFDFKMKDELLEAIKYYTRRNSYFKDCTYCSSELQCEIHLILYYGKKFFTEYHRQVHETYGLLMERDGQILHM